MSLVENLARRHPGSVELMRAIGTLKERGYTNAEICSNMVRSVCSASVRR
jgi:ParB family chromosome partitioning protein